MCVCVCVLDNYFFVCAMNHSFLGVFPFLYCITYFCFFYFLVVGHFALIFCIYSLFAFFSPTLIDLSFVWCSPVQNQNYETVSEE